MEYQFQTNYIQRNEIRYGAKGDYYKQSSGGMYGSFQYKVFQVPQGSYK